MLLKLIRIKGMICFKILVIALFFVLFHNPTTLATNFKEIRADYYESGVIYYIPVYDEDNPNQYPSVEEFYILNSDKQPVDNLAPNKKARLYSLSRGIQALTSSDYWKIRKEAEDIVRIAFGEVEELRDIDVEDILNSSASIFAGALTGCTVGAAAGAVATAPTAGVGAVPGCGLGAATFGGAAAIDVLGGFLVDAITTHDDASRESIVISESRALLGIIYEQSGSVKTELINWNNNAKVVSVFDFDRVWLSYSEMIIFAKFLNEFLEAMLPDHTELHQKINNTIADNTSTFSNIISAPNIPSGTIIRGVQHFVEWLGPGLSPAELATLLKNELESSYKEWNSIAYNSSPTNSYTIENFQAQFEEREPAIFEQVSLSGSVFNVNESLLISSYISKNSSPYPDGKVNFAIIDRKGNTVKNGELVFDGTLYKRQIEVGSSPGKYMVAFTAFDLAGNKLGTKTDIFGVNNPAEGHDLSITGLNASKFNLEPGKDTVTLDITVRNNGIYNEKPLASFIVYGPAGYHYTGNQQTLPLIEPDFSQSFSNLISWKVPVNASNGSYTIEVEVRGQNGDFTFVDNRRFQTVYVGKIPPNTSEMLAGSGWFAYYHTQSNLGGLGAFDKNGMYGWVHYPASNGKTYHVAITDEQSKKYGMVVKRGTQVIVSELGFDADFYYDDIVYVDDHLAIFVEDWGSNEKYIYFAEPIQGVGIEPKERATIPNTYVDYFANLGVEPDCNFDSRNIYDAHQDNDGQWIYAMGEETTKLSIKDIDCERSNNGYSFKLTASSPGTYGFAVELEQREAYYNPSISADSATGGMEVNERMVWLVGRLVVEDFNDVAITNSDIPSGRSGDILDLSATVSKQGTLTPPNIEMKWSITGPNNFQHDAVFPGNLGFNYLKLDTNGLDSGIYTVKISALSSGDIDPEDAFISKTFVLDPPIPTQVVASESTNYLVAQSERAGELEETTQVKSGALQVIKVELRDENGKCREDGLAYAIQLNSSNEPITIGSTPLRKIEGQCLFHGRIDVTEQTTAISIVGHLNRYDDGLLEKPISVIPNLPPVNSALYTYEELKFFIGQNVNFEANIYDPDGDGVSSFVWTVHSPDGKKSYYPDQEVIEFQINGAGEYVIELESFDGLGHEGTPAKLFLQAYSPGDINRDENIDLLDAILALQILTGINPLSEITTGGDINDDRVIGLEDVIYLLEKVVGYR